MRPLLVAALFLAFAAPGTAETIYKYRSADGKMHYSNRPMRGLELIEAFEYTPPPPAPDTSERRASTEKSDAAGEQRIKKHLAALEAAWIEVQASGTALASAEEALASATPEEGDMQGLATPASAAPPSAGGPMGTNRRAGPSPAYRARLEALEANVAIARQRNQEAWSRYNQLR